jgi:Asp-tRNA(Asn)/Glu-tRNA(Gln) amidotransferase A subunit family amidase
LTANYDLNVPFLSAAATASAIRAKQVSSVEAVQAYLERIDKLDPTL